MCEVTGSLCYFIQATGLPYFTGEEGGSRPGVFPRLRLGGGAEGTQAGLHCRPLPAWTLTVALRACPGHCLCRRRASHQLGVTHKLKRDPGPPCAECVLVQDALFLQLSARTDGAGRKRQLRCLSTWNQRMELGGRRSGFTCVAKGVGLGRPGSDRPPAEHRAC